MNSGAKERTGADRTCEAFACSAPDVSVVIPTYNRPAAIHECVRSLYEQTFPAKQFEVIVVDDGSPQPIEPILFGDNTLTKNSERPRLRVIRQTNAGPAAARNRGAKEARGTLIAFTDDDCRPLPNWLETMVAAAAQYPGAMVGGSTFNGLPHDLFAETSQLILDMVYDHFNASPGHARFLASNNWILPRERFLELGGLDTTFRQAGGEDRDFCDRWTASRHPMIFLADARIEHRHAQNFRKFLNLHYRYGVGAKQFHTRRAARKSGSMRDDIGFHRRLLGQIPRFLQKQPSTLRKYQIAVSLTIWQLANASGFFAQSVLSKLTRTRVSTVSKSGMDEQSH